MSKQLRTAIVTADWKDTNELVESISRALAELNIYKYDLPSCEGQDQIGFIVSNRALSDEEILELDVD